jgi:anti-sigma factor RsiW
MSDFKPQHELDDELLSAYLDDELPAEERAAVEARLSADPAARDLLHQLRAVSQAVQGLPQEVVGHDLSESVLQRVRQSNGLHDGSPPAVADSLQGPRATSNGIPAQLDRSIPTVSIGQSRRGWVWAALAVAAAVLVMVFEPDNQQDQNLPQLAQRDEPLAEAQKQRGRGGQGPLEFRALDEPATAPTETELAEQSRPALNAPDSAALSERNYRSDPSADEQEVTLEVAPNPSRARELTVQSESIADAAAPSTSEAASAITLNDDSRTASETVMATDVGSSSSGPAGGASESTTDTLATATPEDRFRDGAREEKLEDLPGSTPMQNEPAASSREDQLLVVHVLAKPEAVKNKAFEQLLASNGIAVAPNEMADGATGASSRSKNRYVEQSEVGRQLERAPKDEDASSAGDAAANQDLVLVDAPSTTILSCLDGLNRDKDNYLGIAVTDKAVDETAGGVEQGVSTDYSSPSDADFSKRRAGELGLSKYNRGIVPRQQEWSMRDKNLYFQLQTQSEGTRAAGGYGRFGLSRDVERLNQEAPNSQANQKPGETTWGWGVRLRASELEAKQLSEQPARRRAVTTDEEAAAMAAKLGQLRTELQSAAQPSTDRLQVLFVISPGEEEASSPPSRNKAQ